MQGGDGGGDGGAEGVEEAVFEGAEAEVEHLVAGSLTWKW